MANDQERALPPRWHRKHDHSGLTCDACDALLALNELAADMADAIIVNAECADPGGRLQPLYRRLMEIATDGNVDAL